MIYDTTINGKWTCKTPEYKAWDRMKQRCYAPSYKGSKNYKGRGITVCDEWLHDFKTFLEYVGERPSPKYSLDRIDNNGNYEPGNVRWATLHQQHANTRSNNKVVGVQHQDNGWLARLKVDKKLVLSKWFKEFDDAVNARRKAEAEYGIR